MHTQRMMKPILIAGISAGVLSHLPVVQMINCFCCLIIVSGGVLASYLYIKDSPPVSIGDGALLGLWVGVISAVIGAIVSLPKLLLTGTAGFVAVQGVLSRFGLPPEARQIVEFLMKNLWVFILYQLLFTLIGNSIFGTLGGILGVQFFEKRRGASYTEPPPITPPTSLPPPPLPPS